MGMGRGKYGGFVTVLGMAGVADLDPLEMVDTTSQVSAITCTRTFIITMVAFHNNGTAQGYDHQILHAMQQNGAAFYMQQPGGYAVYQQHLPTGARMHPAQFYPTANGPASFPPEAYQNGIFNGNHPAVSNNEALAQAMAADPMFDEDQYIDPYPDTRVR
jgi:hypothetical protein